MKINPQSWHYKLYAFNAQLVAAWFHKDNYHYEATDDKNVGLCPYMRMILLWGPIVMLTYTVPLGALGASFVWLPVIATSGMAYLWMGAMAAVVAATIWSAARPINYEKERVKSAERKRRREYAEENPGFMRILWNYVLTAKTKVCPILEVDSND